jgi:peptide/nickel transport system permease protein
MSDVVLDILTGASLGFFGLGVQPPTPEWGVMIADGRDFITTAWWIVTFPGLAIIVTGLFFSLVGDGLADVVRRLDEA